MTKKKAPPAPTPDPAEGTDQLLAALRASGLHLRDIGEGGYIVTGRGLRGEVHANNYIYAAFDEEKLWDKMGTCPVRLVTRDMSSDEIQEQIKALPARLDILCTMDGYKRSKARESW